MPALPDDVEWDVVLVLPLPEEEVRRRPTCHPQLTSLTTPLTYVPPSCTRARTLARMYVCACARACVHAPCVCTRASEHALSFAQAKQSKHAAEPLTAPPGHAASVALALCNTMALAAALLLVGFGTWLVEWHLAPLLPDVMVVGAIALGGAAATMSLLGCTGAACSSRQALLVYTLLLLPCLVGAAAVTWLSVAGSDAAVATLSELGDDTRVSRAAIGDGAVPALSSGSSDEMLRTLYTGWEQVYLDCAPSVAACERGSGEAGSASGALSNSSGCPSRPLTAADYAAMALNDTVTPAPTSAVACSSDEAWRAAFGPWASDACVVGADDATVGNCSLVVAALANTSGTGGEADASGALWLFCACAGALADDVGARTEGVTASAVALCGLLALLLLVDAFTLREVTRRAKWRAAEREAEARPEREGRVEAKRELLWQGLQLATTEQAEQPELSDWDLIRQLKRRVQDAGLSCRLLKLMPEADKIVEAADECEFPSGHMVALLAIGEGRVGGQRLLAEAEAIGLRLPTKDVLPGKRVLRTEFRRELRHRFTLPLTSANRLKLTLSVLAAPVKRGAGPSRGGVGAGLDLEALQASGRVRDVFLMHDDDEAEALVKLWTRSCVAGIREVSRAQLRALQEYLGAELGFYFSWASFYTRYLWAPALLGLVVYIAQEQLEGRISDDQAARNASAVALGSAAESDGVRSSFYNATVSDEPSPERMAKESLTALYALFMSVWAAFFVERWKRRAKLLCLDWDVIGQGASSTTRLPLHPKFKEDAVRPGFYTAEGDWVDLDKSKIREEEANLFGGADDDGGLQTVRSGWHDPRKHLRRHLCSLAIIVTMALACVGAIVGVLIVRLSLTEWHGTYGSPLASLVNAIVISVFNTYWRKVALLLTTWENYRLEKDFRDQLVLRMFGFQFINCYFSLFYVAFAKRYGVRYSDTIYDHCEPDACMAELQGLIFFILLFNLVVGSAMEMWLPLQKQLLVRLGGAVRGFCRRKRVGAEESLSFELDLAAIRSKKQQKKRLTQLEQQRWDENQGDMNLVEQFERTPLKSVQYGLGATFYEYNELAVQFGYITMFSVVLPIGALFALVNNFCEVRLDAAKVLEGTRRVKPSLMDGIGAWAGVINGLAYLGVVTNLLILAFTSSFLDAFQFNDTAQRVGFFIAVEHLVLLLKLVIDWASPDVPANVRKSVARDDWLAKSSFKPSN